MTTGANYQRINLLIDSSQRQNAGDSNSNFSVNLSNAYQVKLARLKKARWRGSLRSTKAAMYATPVAINS